MSTTNDQQLPEIFPQQYLSSGRLSGQLDTSFNRSPPSTARSITPSTGCRKRTSSPLKRSLEFIRVSRHEWEYREGLIITLRNEIERLKNSSNETTETSNNFVQLLSSCQALLGIISNEEPTTETAVDILIPQITNRVQRLKKEHCTAQETIAKSKDELDTLKGELAAADVKLNTSESQLEQVKVELNMKVSQLLKFKNEAETCHQNQAKTNSSLQLLKNQITSLEQQCSENKAAYIQLEKQHAQLQKLIKDKEKAIQVSQEKLHQMQIERDELQERATVADSAYEEIWCQLAETLQSEDNCDFDEMLLKINSLMSENTELSQRTTTLSQSLQATELDTKANRETILRLTTEIKKNEKKLCELSRLQQLTDELKEKLEISEMEKENLLSRLSATKSNVVSLEQELSTKNMSCVELKKTIESMKAEHTKERDNQHQYIEFYNTVTSLLGCQSTDCESVIKQKLQDMTEMQLLDKSQCVSELQNEINEKDVQNKRLVEKVESGEHRISELISQLHNIELLEKQLHQNDDKYKTFVKKCASTLKVEDATSNIMAGDLAEDCILMKAEQLCKSETQALAERQSTVYSLQRKLKSCRQQLETKELQVNLLQRKVTALEARIVMAVEKETEWQSTIDRGKKMTDQLERLQNKLSNHKQLKEQLKEDSEALVQLKMYSDKQDTRIKELEGEVETLQENRIHLSQQLADARQKVNNVTNADKSRADELEKKLKATLDELTVVKERETKLAIFHTNVHELVDVTSGNDEELMKQLKHLKLYCHKYKDLSHDLQASLKTMESGFRTSYEDALTLLNSEM